MNNNDVLRKVRYIFDYSDDKMMSLFKNADLVVNRAELSNWLKPDTHEDFKVIIDQQLSAFLNGFIVEKRGRKEGQEIVNEKRLNNNQIFRKMKIALNYRDTDLMEMFDLADLRVSKHEISAIFRKPTQSQYRECKDQFLRNFFTGLQLKLRPNS